MDNTKKAFQEDVVKTMLREIGDDPTREGLKGTPERIVRMWKELFRGYDKKQQPKVTAFNNGHDGLVYDEMIHDEGSFYSFCEHHMLPFFGKYYFAYIPHAKGKIVGISKVARVVDYFSAKLQIQERLVHEIGKYLWEVLSDKENCKYPPLGMALVMEGEHLCKTMRGARKKGKMRTTKLIGNFKNDPNTRSEFLNWVNSCKR